MSYFEDINIKTSDSASIDAFGRWRVSNVQTLFDSKLLHDKNPLSWDEETNGTGSSVHSTTDARVRMSVSSNGDYVIRQTKNRFNYQPGKSQLIIMTFLLGSTVASTTKRVGYFNSSISSPFTANLDGIYLEDNGTNVGIIQSKNGTATRIVQSSWNIDNFDGDGPSGVTIDFSTCQIMFIDFEWLGVGRVRVGFVIDGKLYVAHEFLNANSVSSVYMSSPNHSVRYEIRSTGGSSSIDQICSTVKSEGGIQSNGIILSQDLGASDPVNAQTAGTYYALVGLRLKTTHLDSTIDILNISAANVTGSDTNIRLILNPTISGTFTYGDITNSSLQSALGNVNDNTVTGGTVLFSNYYGAASEGGNNVVQNALRLGSSIDGTRDEIVLAVSTTATNEDVYGSITWREIL